MKSNVMYRRFGGRLHYCWRNKTGEERHWKGGSLGAYYGPDLDRDGPIKIKSHVEYWIGRPLYLFGGSVEFGYGDEPVSFSFYLWPFSLYGDIDSRFWRGLRDRIVPKYQDREIRFVASSRDERTTVKCDLWMSPSEWHSKDPKWRRVHFNLADFVLGRKDVEWESIETVPVSIPMFEGYYEATVEMRYHVSWRKRLPFIKHRHKCANVEIEKGIGFPGKGENSWDCGDDALFGMSCPANSVEEAIGKTVASVLRNRMRYGGSYQFTPQEKAA